MVVCWSVWASLGVRSSVWLECTHGAGIYLRNISIAIVMKMGNFNRIAGWGAIKQTFYYLMWELIVCEDARTNSWNWQFALNAPRQLPLCTQNYSLQRKEMVSKIWVLLLQQGSSGDMYDCQAGNLGTCGRQLLQLFLPRTGSNSVMIKNPRLGWQKRDRGCLSISSKRRLTRPGPNFGSFWLSIV